MTTQTTAARSDAFNVGYAALLIISACATLNHLMLPIYDKDNFLLAVFTVFFSVYSLLVLAIPYRRSERWAWFASWMPVLAFGSLMFLYDPSAPGAVDMRSVVWTYFIAAIAMAISLGVAYPTFFPRK